MSKELTPEQQRLIAQEEELLGSVLSSLQTQLNDAASRFSAESARARALSSEIVAANRAEDKQMLASDEAVSHGLTDQKRKELASLGILLKKPYFARMELKEEDARGQVKSIAYKLGFAANPTCRIVDWRKAPIAKIFYEYRQGDEYSEEILGVERNGTVEVRNTLDIVNGSLKRLSSGKETFEKRNDGWRSLGSSEDKSGTEGLPEILSLITPEQFKLITEDATSAVLIQGIAGSGKTTVALHRVAWLLHEANSPLKPEDALIIVFSPALKLYISKTLPSMGIEGVRITTFSHFALETLSRELSNAFHDPITPKRPPRSASKSISRVKRSLALLSVVEELVPTQKNDTPYELILRALSDPRKIIERDETKLLSAELIREAHQWTKEVIAADTLDRDDEPLLMRIIQLRRGAPYRHDGRIARYEHIVLDEIQDSSPAEISCVIGSVPHPSNVTLVGDVSQQSGTRGGFPGWDKLRERWALKESIATFVQLSISHRSTLPIMRLAEFVQQRALVTDGRPGRVPIWFLCKTEDDALQAAREWLVKAMERYPTSPTALICATAHEVKYLHSLLTPTFGQAVRIGDEHSFSFEEGIVVTTAVEVKGLEFTNVLIWNPTEQSYESSSDIARNLLYIAITRAQENVALVSFRAPTRALPSPRLEHPTKQLLRIVDLTIQEEEQKEEADGGLDGHGGYRKFGRSGNG
jgi:DNA helicase-2/ATP-dependent DNA helicase PcrA